MKMLETCMAMYGMFKGWNYLQDTLFQQLLIFPALVSGCEIVVHFFAPVCNIAKTTFIIQPGMDGLKTFKDLKMGNRIRSSSQFFVEGFRLQRGHCLEKIQSRDAEFIQSLNAYHTLQHANAFTNMIRLLRERFIWYIIFTCYSLPACRTYICLRSITASKSILLPLLPVSQAKCQLAASDAWSHGHLHTGCQTRCIQWLVSGLDHQETSARRHLHTLSVTLIILFPFPSLFRISPEVWKNGKSSLESK